MNSRVLLLLSLTSVLFFQNCRKDNDIKDDSHWDYEHPDWTHISSDCGGIIQSPVNIDTTLTLKADLPDLEFGYGPFPFAIVDNGHTIQVSTKTHDGSNTLVFNDETYKLKQFHFHAKSEHQINGRHAPMELHLVHQATSGALLVVGFMIEEGDNSNPLVTKIWDAIPAEQKKEVETGISIDLSSLLPGHQAYYNYIGSLTTPPCSMGLQWILMKEPIRLSSKQIEDFRSLYNHNYRPVQPLNNRIIYEKR